MFLRVGCVCVGGGGAVHCRDAETKPGLGLVRLNQSFYPSEMKNLCFKQHWVGDGRSVGRLILSCRVRSRVDPLSRIVVFWDWPCTFVGFVIRCRKKGSLGSFRMFCSAVETPVLGLHCFLFRSLWARRRSFLGFGTGPGSSFAACYVLPVARVV